MGEFQQFLSEFVPQLPLPLILIVCGGPVIMVLLLLFLRGSSRTRRKKDSDILHRPLENDTIPVEVNAEADQRWIPVEESFSSQNPVRLHSSAQTP
ncbi:MAG: hypothetical protein KC496_06675, partial [Anaerolineae bacterium]|nr:hypothetical protein [Anaerolineae bacterium]